MNNDKLIISGHRLELTAAIKSITAEKCDKLFKHDDSIIRIRVELEHEPDGTTHGAFQARGQIESRGPIMTVSVKTEDLYKSIDLMVDKLDRKLRRRHRINKAKRNQPREDVDQLPEAVSF